MRLPKFKAFSHVSLKMSPGAKTVPEWIEFMCSYADRATLTMVLATMTFIESTGLRDKNGKEIFSGDIVKLHCGGEEFSQRNQITATITWIEDNANFIPLIHDKKILVKGGSRNGQMVNMREIHGWHGMHHCFSFESYIEVIGNIYENPDLLK